MLVNSTNLLLQAKEKKCAVPAVNVFELAGIKAAASMAEQRRCPLIIALAEVHVPALSIEEAAHIVRYYAEKNSQEIVLHYDHGFTPDMVKLAVDCGFTSVMIDASSQSFSENVRITKEIVTYAHTRNVSVEAEIGHVGGGESYLDPEDDECLLTEAADAAAFVAQTGVDSLAVSIGTAHGEYKGTPHLDFQRLQDIAAAVPVPLVLHGGSGSGDENLNRAVHLGICKVNVFTDLIIAARNNMKDGFADRSYYDSYFLGQKGMGECISRYYDVFETSKMGGAC